MILPEAIHEFKVLTDIQPRLRIVDEFITHIMYGLAGERRLTEYEVPWLAGYEGATPVRIGNAAS